MIYVYALILATVFLLVSVYNWYVVIQRAVVCHLITVWAKGLRRICVSTKIYNNGLSIAVYHEGTHIIVVMALGVVASLGSY